MTARLPTVGSDSGTWGDVLNAFLAVGHDAAGNNIGVSGTPLQAEGSLGVIHVLSRASLAGITLGALGTADATGIEIHTSQYYAAATTCPAIKGVWRWAAATDNVASTVAADASIGGYWVQKFPDGYIDVRQFGAYGDWNGTTGNDDTAAIQNALDAAAYLLKIQKVFLPNGRYKTTDTLHMGYGVSYAGSSYTTLEFYGASGDSSRSVGRGSQLDPQFSNRPVVNIQGCRWSRIHNIGFVGLNRAWIQDHALWAGSASLDMRVAANWVDTSLHANANSRYAPYAAITIDAYGAATAPTPAYPDVTFPAFLGSPTQYNKVPSSFYDIDRCYITGFVVGIAVAPSGNTGQADFFGFSRNWIDNCVYIISISTTDSREVTCFANYLNQCHTAITNNIHGGQTGQWGGAVINTGFDRMYQIMDFGSLGYPRTGPLKLQSCYGEQVYQIGNFGTGFETLQQTLLLEQCEFGFQNSNATYAGRPNCYLQMGDTAQLIVKGGTYQGYTGAFAIWAVPDQCSIEEAFFSPAAPTTTYGKTIHTASSGQVFFTKNNLGMPRHFTAKHNPQYNYDGAQRATKGFVDDPVQSDRLLPVCIHSRRYRSTTVSNTNYIKTGQFLIGKGSLASVTLTGTTLTFTYTGRTDAQFGRDGGDVGDVIIDYNTSSVFYIRSRTGTAITAELQNNYWLDGSATVSYATAFSTTTGNLHFINCRQFAPQYPLYANISSASADLTNATSANGNTSVLTAGLAAGDHLQSDQWTEYYSSASGTNSIIQSIDSVAKTITLGGNLNVTFTDKQPFPLWVRAANANS